MSNQNQTPATETMEQIIARLTAENQALKGEGNKPHKLTLKVQREERIDPTTKAVKPASGAVSLYGLGRFPVTLYKTQWARLLDAAEQIKAFLADPVNQPGMSQEK